MLSNLMAINVPTLIMMGALVVLVVVFMVFNRKTQAKKQQEAMDMLNAIKPGNKVKTIGGICGIVVEVCPEDNTFILETGSEVSGKSYIKFDKQAVYQTDAVVEKAASKKADAEVEDTVNEDFAKEKAEAEKEKKSQKDE